MKNWVITLTCLFGVNSVLGQLTCNNYSNHMGSCLSTVPLIINDGTTCAFIDTIAHPNNIWQVGKPNKTVFDMSGSTYTTIVTDTISPYPVNDTSSFILSLISCGGYHQSGIEGSYKVNSDTLSDYGKIEYSFDKGNTWLDILTDSLFGANTYWATQKPTFTGNSEGYFRILYFNPYFIHETYPDIIGDTLLVKFTFISDSIDTGKDGLMFYDVRVSDNIYSGLNEHQKNEIGVTVYPNPANDRIIFKMEESYLGNFQLVIYDNLGKEIHSIANFSDTQLEIDSSPFAEGLYSYRIMNSTHIAMGKFMVKH